MNKEQQERLIKAYIQEKIHKEESFSEGIRKTQNALAQFGIWEESKDILREYILTYYSFLGDVETEFYNGELKRKRNKTCE